MLKNSSTLAVSVLINLSIKLGFVAVHGPRETYFVDALRIIQCCQLLFTKISVMSSSTSTVLVSLSVQIFVVQH